MSIVISSAMVEGASTGDSHVASALFFVDSCSYPLADVVQKSGSLILIKEIFGAAEAYPRKKLSEVYLNEETTVLVVRNCAEIPATVMRDWFANVTSGFNISAAIILDGIHVPHFITEESPRTLKFMATTAAKSTDLVANSVSCGFDKLGVGILVTSCSALLIVQFELSRVPALLLLCDRELSFTVESAKCFEQANDLLRSFLRMKHSCVPSTESYSKYVSIDPFLTSTGNIYT